MACHPCWRRAWWWKWLIAFTVSLQYFLLYGSLYNYSILFLSLQAEFESGAVLAGWPGSLSNALSNLFSPVTALVLLRLRHRTLVIIGHVVICIGTMLTSLIPALVYAVPSYGVMVGVGTNFVVHSVTGLCLDWFKSGNFGRANAVVVLGSSLGLLAFAPLMTSMIGRFGWRRALRYIGGGVVVFGVGCSLPFFLNDPPSRENVGDEKKEKSKERIDLKEIEPLDPLLNSSNCQTLVSEAQQSGSVRSKEGKDLMSWGEREEDSSSKEIGQDVGAGDRQPENRQPENRQPEDRQPADRRPDDARNEELPNKDKLSKDLQGTMWPQMEHGKDHGVTLRRDVIGKTTLRCHNCRNTCRRFIGVDQLAWTIGLCLALVGWTFFIINFASFIEGRDLSRERVSFVIMSLAVGEICGKILVCVVGDHIPCQRSYILSASSLLATVAVGFMTTVRTFPQMMVLSIASGLIRSVLYALSNTTAADLFLQYHGSNGVMVLAMVPYGLGMLLGAPLSGGLYDITGDYVLSLTVIAAIFLCACAAFLFIAVRRRMESRGSCCYATAQTRPVPL